MRSRPVALLAGVLAAAGLTACERADERAADTGVSTLTVYASLPLQGPGGPDSQAVANGVRLALRQAGGKVGDLVLKLVVLDDSTPKAGHWDPEQTAENARVVARDRTSIAYLGDGTSGATAISLPILNAAGIAQVSPSSGYAGLTTPQGADKGEPEKYYPSGVRTFARPVPNDQVQVRALLAALRVEGCTRLQLIEDQDVAARGLSTAVELGAPSAGVRIVHRDVLRPQDDPVKEARKVAGRAPDCALFTAALAGWVPPLFDALHAAAPRLRLLGTDGLASEAFASALDAGTQGQTQLTAPPGLLEPRAAVRTFARRYERVFGEPARDGALYGYDAMELTLRAVRAAGPQGNNRTAVVREMLGGATQLSPLGAYRIGPRGDSSSTRYSTLGVREGRLVRLRTGDFPG